MLLIQSTVYVPQGNVKHEQQLRSYKTRREKNNTDTNDDYSNKSWLK